ncbi:MAG TPA: LysR family transcriptional regulator, partial [Luteimonas sp.]|nr:LysR family transcriptional regulator [Luteimonas sp.]
MSLRKYRYFITIVDAGSLTKAAALLHVAQPALTQQLHALESDIGVKLLERTPRGVRPTDAGHLFYERAGMILRLADSIRRDVGFLHENPTGEVSIGIPTSTALMLAIPILESVRTRYPGIRLRILTGVSGHLESLLHAGHLDMTVLFRPSREGLVVEWLLEEAMYMMALPDM